MTAGHAGKRSRPGSRLSWRDGALLARPSVAIRAVIGRRRASARQRRLLTAVWGRSFGSADGALFVPACVGQAPAALPLVEGMLGSVEGFAFVNEHLVFYCFFRYETAVGHYILFTARTGIRLVFEGPAFTEWEISALCSIDDKSSRTPELNCPVAGTHMVKPIIPGALTFQDRERYLTINADLNCFLWYVYTSFARFVPIPISSITFMKSHETLSNAFSASVRLEPASEQQQLPDFDSSPGDKGRSSIDSNGVTLVVWIFDPENADSKEKSHTAKVPPEHSKTLTRQFLNLGQAPSVKLLHISEHNGHYEEQYTDGGTKIDSSFIPSFELAETVFSISKELVVAYRTVCNHMMLFSIFRYWEIDVPSISDYIIGEVRGKPVTFQGCFVSRTPFIVAKSEIPPVDIHDVSISTPAGSELMITWSACHPTTVVVMTDYGAFLTHDEFRNSKGIKFPSTVLDPAVAQKVNDIAITEEHMIFLIDDSIYIINNDEIFRAGRQHKLPESGILGIEARTWCLRDYPVQESNLSDALLWTQREIFLLYPSRKITDMFILIMEVDVLRSVIGFEDHVNLAVITACYDSIPSEISVLLACTGCKTSTQLYVVGYNEDDPHWFLRDFSLPAPTSDPMHMKAVFAASSSMLLWYSDKIFYSYKGSKVTGYIKEADTGAELSARALGTVIHQVVIGSAGNTVIKMRNNAMFFLKFNMKDVLRLNDWETEAKNFAIYVNAHGDFYLLISNGTHVYFEAYPLKTEVLSATNSLGEVCPYISFQHNMEAATYYLDMGTNMTFWTQIVFLENVGLSSEVTIFRSHLLKKNNSIQYEIARGICTKNQTVTLYHDYDYSNEEEYEDAIVSSTGIMTIEVEPSLTGRTCMTPNKEQEYDLALFGCPIEVYHGDPFRPTVLLYEHEDMIGTVEADYILWEINGRNDYYYNTTVEEVRCLSKSQNMSSMVPQDLEKITAHTIDRYWGRHNYISCFVSGGPGLLGTLHNQYELMNHSGINSIIWPEDYAGIFMFRLKIIDPNYSFCPYEAYFAVHTHGIIESLNMLKIAGWACLIVIFFWGVLAFSYYRYVKLFRELHFADPMASFHSDISSDVSSEDGKKYD
ncbi:cation channel sperm-associated auxiliary subunit epsilon [Zootoca vivipara]|uniref:cation channel sperm-associated auxiliary subunit epsilon n=1 Tax=Zootoca vivipara TaxID=8524 RepID=UPI00293BD1FC|nr:cation channel sperm-associated auxiliary subunit epsilon [Zootoca vivipara]